MTSLDYVKFSPTRANLTGSVIFLYAPSTNVTSLPLTVPVTVMLQEEQPSDTQAPFPFIYPGLQCPHGEVQSQEIFKGFPTPIFHDGTVCLPT